ncbi:MAG: DUF1330 domain-containing protein [Gammaproteobacteria bacterium]|nr:DUF1330 domain-containing protein [Gammaproteobacteria bacterium]
MLVDSKEKDTRVFMFHAMWFKPDGGAETYQKYLKRAIPLVESVGGRKLRSLEPERALVGEFDADLMFFVEYPSWAAYKKFVSSPDHHKIAYLRESALDKMILLKCNRPINRRSGSNK